MGKGAEERIVPLGTRAQRVTLCYVNCHRPEPASPRTWELLLTHSGERLENRHVQELIKRYGQKAHIAGVGC